MLCPFCQREFELCQEGSGGSNRIFCYDCLPIIRDRHKRNRARYVLLRKYANRLKREKGCARCGYNEGAAAVEWHHPENDKDGDPSTLLNKSLKAYLDEVNKCILLCSNCHREIHCDNEDY